MKKILRKSSVREIKGSFGRFAAILSIIALGVGFFTGVRETTPAMVNMMDKFYIDHSFYDYQMISTMGWDDESIEKFRGISGVRCAEGTVSLDAVVNSPSKDTDIVMKINMLPGDINRLMLTQGRLPETKNECFVIDRKGFKLGDKIRVSADNEDDTLDILGESEYEVVGLGFSSYYVNGQFGTTSIGSGSVACAMYLPTEAFDCDYYTSVFVKLDSDYAIYSDEYKQLIDSRSEEWERLSQDIADLRYDDAVAEAKEKIEDGKKELEEKRADGQKELDDAKKELDKAEKELKDAEKELKDAEKELADGKKQLDDAKKELDNGKKELKEAKNTLDESKKTLDESEQQLIDGETQLDEGQEKIDEGRAEYESGLAEFQAQEADFNEQYGAAFAMIDYLPPEQQAQLRGGKAQLDEAKAKLDSAYAELEYQQGVLDGKRTELESGRAEFESGREKYEQGLRDYKNAEKKLADGEKEYNDSLKKYEDGLKEYNDGREKYEDGLKEYADGKKEYADGLAEFDEKIADAEAEIADAEKELADVDSPDVFILGRTLNAGYASFENDSEIVEQVARVFPIFFILVAALVCMTTMSRMVEEQRTQIGTLKALGYSEGSVMGKFMFYSGSAAVIGCILGFAGGTALFPAIIWNTYKIMYLPIDVPYMFNVPLAVGAAAASLLCSLGTTWISCRVELAETAASLMRPKAPKAGKRVLLEYVPFIWRRLKFLHKVSVRNIFRYKGRFFMMIIGIGGCTALLLTGFGLKDSVAGFADVQYDEIQTANAEVWFDCENVGSVRDTLAENTAEYSLLRQCTWDILYGDKAKSILLMAVEDYGNMDRFMKLNSLDGEPLGAPALGEAFVSHSIATRYNAEVGSEITVRDPDMNEMKLTVAGVFENHVYNYIYISAETWEKQTGSYPELNMAFVNFRKGSDHHKTAADMTADSDITRYTIYEDTKARMADTMSSLNYIVILVIFCAACLAFIVIYNLTNINITERIREIATIKVLGFFRNETSAYVLRENLVLTALGTAVGLLLGVSLHRFVIAQIVVEMVDFSVRILPMSYVYSIILTFVFNFMVNLFMEIKLERINMAESLKSVD